MVLYKQEEIRGKMINCINKYNVKRNNCCKRQKVTFGAKPVTPETALHYINKIKSSGAKKIYLFGHSSLDDDALCSVYSFSHLLKKLGINNSMCGKPEQLRWLYLKGLKDIKAVKTQPDLIVTLDFNDAKRIPKLFKNIFKGNKPGNIIGLDHHQKTNSLDGDFYIDDTARSCCGIIYRFAEALKVKLNPTSYESMYCGMLSDYQKHELINIKNGHLIKNPKLFNDKNSLEVLEGVEKEVNEASRIKVLKHLDIMNSLTDKEKTFNAELFSSIKTTPNGKLAYVVIDPNDKHWRELGMDNDRNSLILRSLRIALLNSAEEGSPFNAEQKELFKNVKASMIFYRTSPKKHGLYQMSIHSKDGHAQNLIDYIKTNIDPNLEAGGHKDRAGGRVHSLSKVETNKFINYFLTAAENLD